jgi:uncharacterized damage-inducible protein DinB
MPFTAALPSSCTTSLAGSTVLGQPIGLGDNLEMRTSEGEPSVPERWSRATARPGSWRDPDDDPRQDGRNLDTERSVLLAYLRAQRLTLELKCDDLDVHQMARRSVPPSTMSLLGLVRHLADVERHWFRRVMAGEQVDQVYRTDADRDAAWNGAVPEVAVVADAWTRWRQECAAADELLAATSDLAATGRCPDGSTVSLREVLVHMIEEYARHNGHADLIRERIDGRVGE